MSSTHLPKGVFSNLPEILLVLGTVVALIWRNSGFGDVYEGMLHIWIAILHPGVHATVAGVALALTVPASSASNSLMTKLEHALQPWINFLILPIFALSNVRSSLCPCYSWSGARIIYR